MKIFGFEIFKRPAPPIVEVQNAANENRPEAANIHGKILFEQTLYRVNQDIATWRAAIASAENIQFPNRTELLRHYKDTMNDAHLSSLIETRKQAILSSGFVAKKKDKVKEDQTALLQSKWFYDFTNESLNSIFYGHSLIQFGNLIDDNFTEVELIPRHHVKPELNIVVSNPSDITGTSYLEAPFNKWCIGVGSKTDLGLLHKCVPLIIWKKNALQSWAVFTARFGSPLMVGKTNTRDEKTRDNMSMMLKNLETAGWGVVDTEDVIEFIEVKNTDVYQVFKELIDLINSELSKLILGQTSTSDQKAYVGSAVVHERVMQQVNAADKVFIENIYKYQLVPFLNKHNLGFQNLTIETQVDDSLSLMEKANLDLQFLGHYDIDPEYIQKTYGTPVKKKVMPDGKKPFSSENVVTDPTEINNSVEDKMKYYYGE